MGGTGLVARNSASLLDALPVELTDKTPAGNSQVLAADGSLITNFYKNNRTPVTPDQISDVMKQALVDIEDSRFYDHNGLDVQGTLRALVTNVAAGSVQEGGSTLTQQLVKQTLLQTADHARRSGRPPPSRTSAASSREARLALALEETYSKDEILTRYLNIVYFGQGAYGIQAAAQKYFSVNAVDLTLPQAAMLAGLVQSPTNDDPITQPENAVEPAQPGAAADERPRAHHRPGAGRRLGAAGRGRPRASTRRTAASTPPSAASSATTRYSYLTGTLGLTDERDQERRLTIQTTLQPGPAALRRPGRAQHAADGRPAGRHVHRGGAGHRPRARDERQPPVRLRGPRVRVGDLNVAASQGAGSTYKVFTAAAALAEGFGVELHAERAATPTRRGCSRRTAARAARRTCVSNDNAGLRRDARHDVGRWSRSANTYFVGLEDALGSVEKPVRMAAGAWACTSTTPSTSTRPTGTSTASIGSFTLGPTPPARWTWPAPTPRWPPTAPSATRSR